MDATEAAYNAIVNEVLNNLTKNVAKKSIVEKLDEVIPSSQLEPAFKQSETSHEATSKAQVLPNIVVFCSINSGLTPLKYAPPVALIEDHVQKMIGQAVDAFAEKQRQKNELFRLSMQKCHQCSVLKSWRCVVTKFSTSLNDTVQR